LATEIQGLNSLLEVTPPNTPDRVFIERRLAEDLVELESARPARLEELRSQAIAHYRSIVTSHPSYPALDEVLYFLGLEYERDGDLAGARRAYFDLIQKAPASRYVPYAYFAFGEMFLSEATLDLSKLDFAKEAFAKAAEARNGPLAAEALLRVGRIFETQGDSANAGKTYARIVRDYPESEAAGKVVGKE